MPRLARRRRGKFHFRPQAAGDILADQVKLAAIRHTLTTGQRELYFKLVMLNAEAVK